MVESGFEPLSKAAKETNSSHTKIQAPTLIIHGSDDLLIKPSHSEKMASLIHGSKLVIIKGMGHDFNKSFKSRINNIILPHIIGNS